MKIQKELSDLLMCLIIISVIFLDGCLRYVQRKQQQQSVAAVEHLTLFFKRPVHALAYHLP